MDDFIFMLKKLKYNASYPAVFASCGLLVMYLLSRVKVFSAVPFAEKVSALAPLLFGTVFCGFVIYSTCKSAKKAFCAVTSFLCSDMLLYCACGAHFSLLFGVAVTAFFWLVFSKTDLLYAFVTALAVSSLAAFFMALLYENYTDLVRTFALRINGRGAAFGAVGNAFRLFIGDYLDMLFYHKSFSATVAVDGSIVTGALDIFKSSKTPQHSAAEFLAGRYIVTIFIPSGIFAAVFRHLKNEAIFAFASALALSVIAGDDRIFYLLLILYSPLIYVGAVLIIFISYTVCAFIDIRTGFEVMPSVFEMLSHLDKPVYFFAVGVLISVLSYFVSRLIAARFSVFSQNELPRDVLRLIRKLGGKNNILKIENGTVQVANPNLIDILTLDCEIRQNTVALTPDDIDTLRKFVD